MKVRIKGNRVLIKMGERFSANEINEWKAIYEPLPANMEYILNFSRTKYIDSSGLGMMLNLNEHNKRKPKCKIINTRRTVNIIMQTANFQRIFNIVEKEK